MAKLSSTAWILHNLGLATSIGGNVFGQSSLKPALQELPDQKQRDRVADSAWSRFSWLNIASHGVIAATWFIDRSRLSGREVSGTARNLTMVKDALIVASALPRQRVRGWIIRREWTACVRLGTANLVSNIAIAATTTGLSMEARKSGPFAVVSRLLP